MVLEYNASLSSWFRPWQAAQGSNNGDVCLFTTDTDSGYRCREWRPSATLPGPAMYEKHRKTTHTEGMLLHSPQDTIFTQQIVICVNALHFGLNTLKCWKKLLCHIRKYAWSQCQKKRIWPDTSQYDKSLTRLVHLVVIWSHQTTADPNQYPQIAQQKGGNRRQTRPWRNDAGPLAFLNLVFPWVDHVLWKCGADLFLQYKLITWWLCVCIWSFVSGIM